MRTKEYFLVLDTETANGLDQPIPYDIGYCICDREGNIYVKRSFIVREVFYQKGLMQSAYYAQKIPMYQQDIKEHRRLQASIYEIRRVIVKDMEDYHVKKVGAYNMRFDRNALNIGIRYITKSFMRWFFPYGTEYFCIWNMACSSILSRPSFYKFCKANGYISENGNFQTSAEIVYQYMTGNSTFIESHTGLEDVLIEVEIMAYCFRQHKKLESKIAPNCWRKVTQFANTYWATREGAKAHD